jgi:hypothetical protein
MKGGLGWQGSACAALLSPWCVGRALLLNALLLKAVCEGQGEGKGCCISTSGLMEVWGAV